MKLPCKVVAVVEADPKRDIGNAVSRGGEQITRCGDTFGLGPNSGVLDDDGKPLPKSYNRLKEGIERFFITDINNPAGAAAAQSTIFVMFDAWMNSAGAAALMPTWIVSNFPAGIGLYNHAPGGANVLYMDGHVEFVKYNQKPPVATSIGGIAGQALGWWMYLFGGYG